jgi:hypothetical protein
VNSLRLHHQPRYVLPASCLLRACESIDDMESVHELVSHCSRLGTYELLRTYARQPICCPHAVAVVWSGCHNAACWRACRQATRIKYRSLRLTAISCGLGIMLAEGSRFPQKCGCAGPPSSVSLLSSQSRQSRKPEADSSVGVWCWSLCLVARQSQLSLLAAIRCSWCNLQTTQMQARRTWHPHWMHL